MTNHEYLNNMLATIENPNTQKTIENAIKQFLKWVDESYGGMLPEKQAIAHWKAVLQIAESTWYQYYSWVMKYYSYIENPTEYKVRPVHNHTFLRDALNAEQVIKVLDLARQKALSGEYNHVRNHCIIELLFYTGMRIGGIRDMLIEDIRENVQGETRQPIYEIRLKLKGRKTKDHIVIVLNSAYQILKHYLGIRKGQHEEPVFIGLNQWLEGIGNEKLCIETISRMVKGIYRAAGVNSKRLTAHSARHTFATNILENGARMGEAQRSLGHSSIKTTEKYIHMIPKLKGENFINYNKTAMLEGG